MPNTQRSRKYESLLHTLLIVHLREWIPSAHEEMELALLDLADRVGDSWRPFRLFDELPPIITQVANRLLVGPPLCKASLSLDAGFMLTQGHRQR